MILRSGGSTGRPRPSEIRCTITNLLISPMVEQLMICRSGTPMVNGSKCSSINRTTSSTSRIKDALLSVRTEIQKDKMSLFKRRLSKSLRNGTSSTLIKPRIRRPVESTSHMRFNSVNHSSSDQDCQCKELSQLSMEETLSSRLTTEPTKIKSSSLTQPLRPSSLQLERTDQLISKALVALPTFRFGQPMLDGGNSSSTTMEQL